MDRWINGWMNRLMDGWMEKQQPLPWLTDIQMYIYLYKSVCVCVRARARVCVLLETKASLLQDRRYVLLPVSEPWAD